MTEEWTMKHRSMMELQQIIDEQKIIERDWKILKRAQESEKTNLKKQFLLMKNLFRLKLDIHCLIFDYPSFIERKKIISMKSEY